MKHWGIPPLLQQVYEVNEFLGGWICQVYDRVLYHIIKASFLQVG